MRLLCGFFKPGFQVFMVMSLEVWGSVKHCLISKEQCFTPVLLLCVEPVLGANKARLQAVQMRAGRKGALDSIWRPCWKSRILLSPMPCPQLSLVSPRCQRYCPRALQRGFGAG